MKGVDLLRLDPFASWHDGVSFLLLNPRISPALRKRVLASQLPELTRHVWLAASGTGGAFKLIALSRAALKVSALSVNAHLAACSDDVWLNPLPLFHVGGLGMMVRANLSGARHETFDSPWNAQDFTRAAEGVGATLSALVPAQVHDLVKARCRAPRTLRAVVVGGGALAQVLRDSAVELGWPLLQSYGLTEAASQVATEISGGPSTADQLPLLEHVEARADKQGVLELLGPSLLTGWMIFGKDGMARWEDPKREGWFRTSDRVQLCGRELRVLGRIDDLVKIRGELVDVGALENELQARVPEGRVAVRCLPDGRNGATLRVVAANAAALKQARALRDEIFPPYARPQEFAEGPVEVTALGKAVRRPH